jgi:hypothetical protein
MSKDFEICNFYHFNLFILYVFSTRGRGGRGVGIGGKMGADPLVRVSNTNRD